MRGFCNISLVSPLQERVLTTTPFVAAVALSTCEGH